MGTLHSSAPSYLPYKLDYSPMQPALPHAMWLAHYWVTWRQLNATVRTQLGSDFDNQLWNRVYQVMWCAGANGDTTSSCSPDHRRQSSCETGQCCQSCGSLSVRAFQVCDTLKPQAP